jgi:hypothetical protein
MNSEDPDNITFIGETPFIELPQEVINKVEESMPDITVNLPLKDETKQPFLVMPQNFFPDFSYNFFDSILSIKNIDIFLQIILGLLILLFSAPSIPSTFYGYFLIIFILFIILRMTN